MYRMDRRMPRSVYPGPGNFEEAREAANLRALRAGHDLNPLLWILAAAVSELRLAFRRCEIDQIDNASAQLNVMLEALLLNKRLRYIGLLLSQFRAVHVPHETCFEADDEYWRDVVSILDSLPAYTDAYRRTVCAPLAFHFVHLESALGQEVPAIQQ